MKKILITLLTIYLISFGLFAADPDNASFQVTTAVTGINLMKITKAEFTGTTAAAFNSAAEFTEGVSVSSSGSQTFSAWISTLSNSRAGYKVTMSAEPMKSSLEDLADAFIHYTVTANSKSVDTSSSTLSVELFNTGVLASVKPESHQISLSVDQPTFDAAVEGNYIGTVTFAFTGN